MFNTNSFDQIVIPSQHKGTYLIRPRSANFPRVDFIIVNFEKALIYLIQTTVQDPNEHCNKKPGAQDWRGFFELISDNGSPAITWSKLCQRLGFGPEITQAEYIYVTTQEQFSPQTRPENLPQNVQIGVMVRSALSSLKVTYWNGYSWWWTDMNKRKIFGFNIGMYRVVERGWANPTAKMRKTSVNKSNPLFEVERFERELMKVHQTKSLLSLQTACSHFAPRGIAFELIWTMHRLSAAIIHICTGRNTPINQISPAKINFTILQPLGMTLKIYSKLWASFMSTSLPRL